MKAVICTKYGAPKVLQIKEVFRPVPEDDEILIRIHASTVNSADVRVRSLDTNGFMKYVMQLVLGIAKPRKPILGTIFSGRVEEIGHKVTKFKEGDKVFGMTGFKFGTHAEYTVVHQDSNVCEMPNNAIFEERGMEALISCFSMPISFWFELSYFFPKSAVCYTPS